MKKSENETENATTINGVVLTQEIIEEMRYLQSDDNDGLEINLSFILDAIYFIAGQMHELPEAELKGAAILIGNLHSIHTNFNNLRKP